MDILSAIDRYHTLPFVDRPLTRLHNPSDGVANPIYEVEDFLRDRTVLDPPKHADACCDSCSPVFSPDRVISGLAYFCLDCIPDQVDFCSKCVVLPGQGIEHDPTHRLLSLLPTICAVCQDVRPLEEHPGDKFRGPYREYSALWADLKRVAETRACGFCSFVWNALTQHHLDGIQWPPNENKKVTIRIQPPRTRWLEFRVLTDGEGTEEKEVEIGGVPYVVKWNRDFLECESELEVGIDVGEFGFG